MKLWEDMTAEEKGALLLAFHEGAEIEFYSDIYEEWQDCKDPLWSDILSYRVKPKVKKGVIWYREKGATVYESDIFVYTHKITFDIVGGEPDVSTVEMEKIS